MGFIITILFHQICGFLIWLRNATCAVWDLQLSSGVQGAIKHPLHDLLFMQVGTVLKADNSHQTMKKLQSTATC